MAMTSAQFLGLAFMEPWNNAPCALISIPRKFPPDVVAIFLLETRSSQAVVAPTNYPRLMHRFSRLDVTL